MEGEGISDFHVRLNCDYGVLWLHDLAGFDFKTLVCLTREFPIQLSDIIYLSNIQFHIIQEVKLYIYYYHNYITAIFTIMAFTTCCCYRMTLVGIVAQ